MDLGVMVPADRILDEAEKEKADIIGLSGLITPSLDEMVSVAKEMQKRNMKTPLLIGGATTSRIHTAVKIDPNYDSPVIHVLDASRSVNVCSDLLNENNREGYAASVKSEYSLMREDHEKRTSRKSLLSFELAKKNRTSIDWDSTTYHKPKVIGTKVFEDVDLAELRKFIDWSPFFRTWMLTGKYPAILEDEVVGEHAKELFNDAQVMLDEIIANKSLIGLFPANSFGEDVVVFEDESRTKQKTKFHFLRQQAEKRNGQPNSSLVDYVAPLDTGKEDYIGMFAVTSGLGIEKLIKKYETANDDYNSILVKALADRLAEAHAEYMHYKIRTDLWGFCKDEDFDNEKFIAEEYQGIRPAPGYPACPDHTEKRTLFDVLEVEKNTGISLTESFAMYPASSVSGFYFSHPQSRYFGVGKLSKDQIEDYAQRKGKPIKEIEKWLSQNLAYNL